jgi:hypothetical protein
MITKTNKIKDFGVFKNFKNNDIAPEFNKFKLELFSQKLMLSRMFRCLEKG